MTAKKKKSWFKRILKWTGITFLVLLILAIVLPYVFKDQIIAFIETEAETYLDAKVDLGEVELSFISTFPNFVLEMKNTNVSGLEKFKDTTLFSSKSLDVSMNMKSVLFGDQYEINGIHLDGALINVFVHKNGQANYNIMRPDSTVIAETEVKESTPFKLALQEYSITNTQIVYNDRATDFYTTLNNFNHTGSGDFTSNQLILDTKTTADTFDLAYGSIPYLSETKLDADLKIDMDLEKMKFTFAENNLSLNDFNLGFEGFLQLNEEDMDMDLSFVTKDNKFRNLLSLVPAIVPDLGGIKTDGTVDLHGSVKGRYSEISMPAVDAKIGVDNAWFKYPDLPGKVDHINIDVTINSPEGNDLNKMKIDVNKAHADYGDNYVDATLHLRNTMVDPHLNSTIKSFIDLSKLKELVPVAEGEDYSGIINSDLEFNGYTSAILEERYQDFKASGNASVEALNYKTATLAYEVNINTAKMDFNPEHLALTEFTSTIGKSDVSASGKLTNYLAYVLNGDKLKGNLEIHSNFMDLDELMGTSEEPVVTETISTVGSEEVYAVVALPENIDFDMATTVNKIAYDGMDISNVKGNVNLSNSVAQLTDVTIDMLGGNITMNGAYDTKNSAKPNIAMNFKINDFDINKTATHFNTVARLAPIAKKCTGLFSSKLNFNSDLDGYYMPVYSSLSGAGDLFTKSVFIEGFEPLNKLAEKLKINRLAKQTINNVKCFYKIENGNLVVDQFPVKMGNINAKVQGTTSLEQDISYQMAMDIPKSSLGGQASSILDDLSTSASKYGVNLGDLSTIPVKIGITGTVLNPKITTDFLQQGEELKAQVIEEVKTKINDEIGKVQDNVNEQIDKIMATAQEQADKIIAEAKVQSDKVRAEGVKAKAKAIEEGNAQVDKGIEKAAKNGVIAKKLAEKAAPKAKEKVTQEAQLIEDTANKNADKIDDEAKKQSDKIIADAQARADVLKNKEVKVK